MFFLLLPVFKSLFCISIVQIHTLFFTIAKFSTPSNCSYLQILGGPRPTKPQFLQILNGKLGGRPKNFENTNQHSQQQTKQQKLRAPIDRIKHARASGGSRTLLYRTGRRPPTLTRGPGERARARALSTRSTLFSSINTFFSLSFLSNHQKFV